MQPLDLARTSKRKPTKALAKRILQAWLDSRGFVPDRWGNYKEPGEPNVRWHFKTNVVNEQSKRGGSWANRSSHTLIAAATNVVANLAKKAGDDALAERYRGYGAKRRGQAKKRKSRAEENKLTHAAGILAYKALAYEHPEEVLELLRNPALLAHSPLKDTAGQLREMFKKNLADGMKYNDADWVSIDNPPFAPLYHTDINYRWDEVVDGRFDYTIRAAHKGAAGSGEMNVYVGKPLEHGMMDIDLTTGGITDGAATFDAKGDGAVYGILHEDARGRTAALYMLMAQPGNMGVGIRLLNIWCRLMAGYGIDLWTGYQVNAQAETFLKALEKRGKLWILGKSAGNLLVRCR